MTEKTVTLDEQEWSQVISIIASSHPLIAKIAPQLMAQSKQSTFPGIKLDANGKEVRHE